MTPAESRLEEALNCLHAHADDCECRKVLARAYRQAVWERDQYREALEYYANRSCDLLNFPGVARSALSASSQKSPERGGA